ncbi:hypothetical protein [Cupriavidus basilensis]|uniref:hypothetical protein n=1 Tax=Cupriavidus basilensis TaxID=68895 RepID=UPI0020A67CC5|nr:hypothetical protein [Cupriavidus basilensis]MCP3023060.1 hypothetical protein [Cupriavidus basilensis]
MKAVNLAPPIQRWRLYRLSVIARLDDVPDVRVAMRCATSDCGQYPSNERQMPLGLPPIKCMLSFEIRMPQMRAGQLLVTLERALASVPIILLRLEVMGNHAEAAHAPRLKRVSSPAAGTSSRPAETAPAAVG